jgi:uncharacterized membrane protein YgcG
VLRRGLVTLTFAVLVCLVGVSPARADRGGFVIHDFDSEAVVRPDAGLSITERITVDFSEPRHGIYRLIPVRYTDPLGYAYDLGFRFVGAEYEGGRKVGVKIGNQGPYMNLRLGDADRTVTGRQVYVIHYRLDDLVHRLAVHDELYLNATGNEWPAPIENASATVRLPAPLPADSLSALAYTGGLGGRGHDARITFPGPGAVRYEMTHSLGPREGLTVDLTWPSGYVKYPGTLARIGRFFAANWVLLAPFLFAGVLWRRYWVAGRDPRGPAAVMVRYEPPEELTAGEVGTLVDESVDTRDLTAMVVDLAVRGYLTIHVEERSVFLGLGKHQETVFEHRREKSWNDLHPAERRLMAGLFETGDRVGTSDLKQKFYVHIPKIKDALYNRLVDRGYFAGNPATVRGTVIGLGVLAAVVIFAIGLIWIRMRGGVLPNGIVVPIVAAGLTMAVFAAFSPAMPRRTKAGVKMRSWALGFEEFVNRVEKDRLEADRKRNTFEALLPYAMALGVAAAWARKFEGIYDRAAPAWYVGPTPGAVFSTIAFEHSLSSSMSQATQSLTSAPRSSGASGAGGGGFSGGGGGGGGGGSW